MMNLCNNYLFFILFLCFVPTSDSPLVIAKSLNQQKPLQQLKTFYTISKQY